VVPAAATINFKNDDGSIMGRLNYTQATKSADLSDGGMAEARILASILREPACISATKMDDGSSFSREDLLGMSSICANALKIEASGLRANETRCVRERSGTELAIILLEDLKNVLVPVLASKRAEEEAIKASRKTLAYFIPIAAAAIFLTYYDLNVRLNQD
jgi:hypothetical protein